MDPGFWLPLVARGADPETLNPSPKAYILNFTQPPTPKPAPTVFVLSASSSSVVAPRQLYPETRISVIRAPTLLVCLTTLSVSQNLIPREPEFFSFAAVEPCTGARLALDLLLRSLYSGAYVYVHKPEPYLIK